MKVTQHTKLLTLLRAHPAGITTNEILSSNFGLAAEYRARISELRKKGFTITCELRRGGGSVWRLEGEPPVMEPSGQLSLFALKT